MRYVWPGVPRRLIHMRVTPRWKLDQTGDIDVAVGWAISIWAGGLGLSGVVCTSTIRLPSERDGASDRVRVAGRRVRLRCAGDPPSEGLPLGDLSSGRFIRVMSSVAEDRLWSFFDSTSSRPAPCVPVRFRSSSLIRFLRSCFITASAIPVCCHRVQFPVIMPHHTTRVPGSPPPSRSPLPAEPPGSRVGHHLKVWPGPQPANAPASRR